MTTVIIDTKRETIYTDSQLTTDGMKEITSKVYHIGKSKVITITGAGTVADILDVKDVLGRESDWFDPLDAKHQNLKFKKFKDTTTCVFVVQKTLGVVRYYVVYSKVTNTWCGLKKRKVVLEKLNSRFNCAYNQFYITGSGAQYARPLLVATNSPENTIKIISKLDCYTDNNVVSYYYGDSDENL